MVMNCQMNCYEQDMLQVLANHRGGQSFMDATPKQ